MPTPPLAVLLLILGLLAAAIGAAMSVTNAAGRQISRTIPPSSTDVGLVLLVVGVMVIVFASGMALYLLLAAS